MKEYSSVLIIYNPNAKKGKIEEDLPYIKQRLLLRYSTVDSMPTPIQGAEDLAFRFSNKYDIVVACGGDGTIHQVINGVKKANAKCLVGVLPFGTCNDVSRTLGITRKLDDAIDCILRLNTVKYDLIFDGQDYMVYSLAAGYLTATSYEASSRTKRSFGRFAYVLKGIKHFFKFKANPFTFIIDGERLNCKVSYVMLMNGESVGGFKLNKGEDLSNGKVKLVIIKKTKGLGWFFNFAKMFFSGIKSVTKSKNVIVKDVKEIMIENPANLPFTADGEKVRFLKKHFDTYSSIRLIKK